MAGRPGSRARRRFVVGAAAAAMAVAMPVAAAAQGNRPGRGDIVVISRERILRDSAAARRLRQAEAELTERLQGEIDRTKAAFAAEEEELARLRGELPEEEFEARVADFDQRLRLARRLAQERAAVLQKGFQDARAEIVAALPQLIERLRLETGASVVLNADNVLALDPAIDLTERAIALFDAEGPSPAPPELDLPPAPAPPGSAPGAPPGHPAGAGGDAPAASDAGDPAEPRPSGR